MYVNVAGRITRLKSDKTIHLHGSIVTCCYPPSKIAGYDHNELCVMVSGEVGDDSSKLEI